jgi:MFS family permease
MHKLVIATGLIIGLTAAAAQAMVWDHFRRSTNIEDRRSRALGYGIAAAAIVPTALLDTKPMLNYAASYQYSRYTSVRTKKDPRYD